MKLLVLDGNSIINRAYYGIRPLTTREGFFTHAIYGFVTTLQRLLDEEAPEATLLAAFYSFTERACRRSLPCRCRF